MPDRGPRRQPRLLDAGELFDYALKTLSGRALSTGEVRARLRRKAADMNQVEPVVARLREAGLLNDAAFAESYAAARRDNQGFGKYRVLRDLQQRRVSSNVAQKAVAGAFEEVNEEEQIEAYLARRFHQPKLAEYLAEEKNLVAAFRRLRYAGFRSGTAIRVLKRYAARAEELEGMEESEGPVEG